MRNHEDFVTALLLVLHEKGLSHHGASRESCLAAVARSAESVTTTNSWWMKLLDSEKELESRELTQRNLKLEAELRSLEPLRQDALQLRSEAGSLESLRQELTAKVQGLTKELEQQSSENQRIPAMIAERDDLQQELIHARAALDYEKNAKPELMAQVQAVEKDLVTMAQESEKLRAEIEKRRAPPPRVSGYGAYRPPPGMGLQGMYDGGYNTYTEKRYGVGCMRSTLLPAQSENCCQPNQSFLHCCFVHAEGGEKGSSNLMFCIHRSHPFFFFCFLNANSNGEFFLVHSSHVLFLE